MLKLVLIEIVVVLLVLSGVVCAAPVETWSKTFWGINSDEAWSVQQTMDGSFIIKGWTADRVGNYDACLIKVGSASEKSMPGFEAVFAIAGLLAVISLLKRA